MNADQASARPLRRLAAEPLVQFLLAGAVLLLVQRACAPVQAIPHSGERIQVTAPTIDALRASFRQANGRAPDATELQVMIDGRIDAEVLFREALRLGLDREDVIVRREMQRKMRFLIEDVDPVAEPTPAELQAWLDTHAEKYARPEAISFEQVFLSRARHGAQILLEAGQRLAQVRAKPQDFAALSDPFPAGLVLRDVSRPQLEKDFGGAFAAAVLKLAPGQWSEPVRSALGLHLVRVTARTGTRPVSVEEAGSALLVDVRVARREQANRRALQKLRARYQIEQAATGAP